MKYPIIILILIWPFELIAAPIETVLLLIDERSEQKLGSYSAERDALASGILKLAELGAKEVLLKFFLDLPKTEEANLLLVSALPSIPVTLQARIDDTEEHANVLPSNHYLAKQYETIGAGMKGDSGWIPMKGFSQNANAVGFIDSIAPAYLVESYQNQSVGSLYFHALESIYGIGFVVQDHTVYLDGKEIPLNSLSEFEYRWLPPKTYTHLSLVDLLNGDVSADSVKGKYVVFGYDGKDIHQIDTPGGKMNAHLAFYHSLVSVIATIENIPAKDAM